MPTTSKLKQNLPPYCRAYNVGTTNYVYLRRGGVQRRLTSTPGSRAFRAEYAAALAEADAALKAKVAPKHTPAKIVQAGTVAALVRCWRQSDEYRALRKTSRTTFDRVADQIEREHGDKHLSDITPKFLRAEMKRLRDTPGAAFNVLRRWRALFRAGIVDELVDVDPTLTVRRPRHVTDGWAAWNAGDVQKFCEHHGPGTTAHLALVLAAETGSRRGDLARIGPGDLLVDAATRVVGHGIRQQKTGTDVFLPLTEATAWSIMAAAQPGRSTWLVTEYGKSFTSTGLGTRFRKWALAAGINKPLHGLRKYAATRLVDAGVPMLSVMAVTGHRSLKSFQVYIGTRDQRALAIRAFAGEALPGGEVANDTRAAVANDNSTAGKPPKSKELFDLALAVQPVVHEPFSTLIPC